MCLVESDTLTYNNCSVTQRLNGKDLRVTVTMLTLRLKVDKPHVAVVSLVAPLLVNRYAIMLTCLAAEIVMVAVPPLK